MWDVDVLERKVVDVYRASDPERQRRAAGPPRSEIYQAVSLISAARRPGVLTEDSRWPSDVDGSRSHD